MKYLLTLLLFTSCLRGQKSESTQLDREVQELQRLAMWQREYYFQVLKYHGKNADSVTYYEKKMDSIMDLYHLRVRRYDSLNQLFKQ
jgi:hypothetical protein